MINRIRRWIIEMLGGYADPPGTFVAVPGPSKISMWNWRGVNGSGIRPVKIEACTSIEQGFIDDAKRSGVDAGDRIMHVLAVEMVKILFREGLAKISYSNNPRIKDRTYRGTIYVICPEDAPIFGYREEQPGEWEGAGT